MTTPILPEAAQPDFEKEEGVLKQEEATRRITESLAAVNAYPGLLSLLYDLDMLPEQLERGTPIWNEMLKICFVWKQAEKWNARAVQTDAKPPLHEQSSEPQNSWEVIAKTFENKITELKEENKRLLEMEEALKMLPPTGKSFERDLTSLLNYWSKENPSNTADWILARFLDGCLNAFNNAQAHKENQRVRNEQWERAGLKSTSDLPSTSDVSAKQKILEEKLEAAERREAVMREALESAKAALGDNAESQALGGKGIEKAYYHAVSKEITEALCSIADTPTTTHGYVHAHDCAVAINFRHDCTCRGKADDKQELSGAD